MKTMSFDLLFRGLEITSGSRRINEYDMLVENIKRFGLDPAGLAGYLEVFKYGAPPTEDLPSALSVSPRRSLGSPASKRHRSFPGTGNGLPPDRKYMKASAKLKQRALRLKKR